LKDPASDRPTAIAALVTIDNLNNDMQILRQESNKRRGDRPHRWLERHSIDVRPFWMANFKSPGMIRMSACE
jgi:hypothetical protein